MDMNRRNVLTGLGGLAMGGGALLGSGAFSSVEAGRGVEVNIIGDEDGDGDTQDDIADKFVDVRVDVSNSSVSVEDDSGSDISGNSSDQVSLLDNPDSTIIFGTENGLLNDATTEYTDLFIVENADDTTTEDFNVTFGLDGGSWLNLSTSEATLDPIVAGNTEQFSANVDTGSASDGDTDTLNITITPN